MCAIYCVFDFAVMNLFSRQISMLFLDKPDEQILSCIRQYVFWNSAMYIFLVFINIFRYGIQGMGFSNVAMFAGFFELAARGVVALYFVPKFGFDAVCFANPAAWIAADLFLIPAFLVVKKRLERKFGQG